MYFDDMKECFFDVVSAKENGMDEIFELSEQCRLQLYELLDEDGILILEKFILCLDLLDKRCDFVYPNSFDKK